MQDKYSLHVLLQDKYSLHVLSTCMLHVYRDRFTTNDIFEICKQWWIQHQHAAPHPLTLINHELQFMSKSYSTIFVRTRYNMQICPNGFHQGFTLDQIGLQDSSQASSLLLCPLPHSEIFGSVTGKYIVGLYY